MKIAFISDTHCQHFPLPKADLLIHAGDLTGSGSIRQFEAEFEWLSSVKYPLGTFFVPGNHDLRLDTQFVDHQTRIWDGDSRRVYRDKLTIMSMAEKAGIQVVINRAFEIEGVKFWGSPCTPPFMDWAFMESENELAKLYETIPKDTQVLVTHGPAQGLRDLCSGGHVGSSALRYRLDNDLAALRVHAFGHIHEGAGVHQEGRYVCLNASVLDGNYRGFNPITVIDFDGDNLKMLDQQI